MSLMSRDLTLSGYLVELPMGNIAVTDWWQDVDGA